MNIISVTKVTTHLVLIASNVILSVLLFFMVSPHISSRLDKQSMEIAQQMILQSVEADAVSIWNINLQANSREITTYGVRSSGDIALYTEFIEKTKAFKFTKSMTSDTLKNLMVGRGACYLVRNHFITINVVKMFVDNFPKSTVCVVPLMNKATDMPVGYASVVWKIDIPVHAQPTVIRQIESILETTHVAF